MPINKVIDKFSNKIPGSFIVSGKEIVNLKSLGFKGSGVTKVGRLSLRGQIKGRDVKVYSVHSQQQRKLRESICGLPRQKIFYPEIVASNDNLIVERWVDGQVLSDLKNKKMLEYSGCVDYTLSFYQNSNAANKLASSNLNSFCYIKDYLLPRLGPWREWQPLKEYLKKWDAIFLASDLPYCLSHPDLTARNIIKEFETDKLFIVDNELLGVGPGWILDRANAIHGEFSNLTDNKNIDLNYRAVLNSTWKLRLIGSALDSGNIKKAYNICIDQI